jgi:wobble nucleotide-excising tRNase
VLDGDAIEERKKTLKDEPKPSINRIRTSLPNLLKLIERARMAVSKKVTPSQPIQELVADHLLQDWVRNGIEKHRDKKTECAFCGGTLPKDLWQKLDAHFNKESEALRREISDVVSELKAAQSAVNQFKHTDRNSFYNTLQTSYDDADSEINAELRIYNTTVEVLTNNLEKRMQDIFHDLPMEDVRDNTEVLVKKITRINELIDHNNQKTSTLSGDQKTAREELRLSEVAQFIQDIQYDKNLNSAHQLEAEVSKCEEKKSEVEKLVKALGEEKRSLELQMQDESKGAALVNQHLKEFFGHDELKLEPDGAKPNMRFKITRENAEAKNLSEGECSLISFCYFIARIEDELKDELSQNKLVVYIDDPISSLDSNHIFFMFSLIETIIAKPKKYAQLFISTHNLDFFKYIKRLTMPAGKDSVSYFLVERRQKKNERKSFLIKMPPHLRDYVTEFNYLFNEIYKVYKAVNGDRKQLLENSYNQFYNLPNNLRKFLECYLFFRFPNTGNPLDNLPKLFDNHIPALINRVVHEYSHLTYIDRGWMPMDVGEAEECAKLVIEKIKEKDKEQFEALVASVS